MNERIKRLMETRQLRIADGGVIVTPELRNQRLELLAQTVETGTPVRGAHFNMGHICFIPADDKDVNFVYGGDCCGAVACLAGIACLMFGEFGSRISIIEAGRLLGLEDWEYRGLCVPGMCVPDPRLFGDAVPECAPRGQLETYWRVITPQQAAAAVRKLKYDLS